MNKHRKGFTLMEVLVAVLIIGILAAVAVPQYNKAVKRARFAEVMQTVDLVKKALEVYFLDPVIGNETVYFTSKKSIASLQIDLPFDLDTCEDRSCTPWGSCSGGTCENALGEWQVYCYGTSQCTISYMDTNSIFDKSRPGQKFSILYDRMTNRTGRWHWPVAASQDAFGDFLKFQCEYMVTHFISIETDIDRIACANVGVRL